MWKIGTTLVNSIVVGTEDVNSVKLVCYLFLYIVNLFLIFTLNENKIISFLSIFSLSLELHMVSEIHQWSSNRFVTEF